MKRILLGMIALSVVMMADFSRNSAGVVTDSTTGLEWQDDYSDNGGNIKSATWQSAIDYCGALSLDGHDDWRLPNLRELTSLVDDTRYDPAIDTTVFTFTASGIYWSSTTLVYLRDYAWLVSFYDGDGLGYGKDNNYYAARCVRAGE